MFDFSGDETFFFIIALAATVRGGWTYWAPLASIAKSPRPSRARAILAIIPIVGALMTCFTAQVWGDSSVSNHPDYILLFMLGSLAWLFLSTFAMRLLGLSLRDDALERDNSAAAIACGGALLAVAIAYAASNIGGGPTIWTTLLPAAWTALALGLIWLLINAIGGSVADSITIDRDVPTAIRLAAALVASSLILGRAAGGNWISWDQTWADFLRRGWPALAIAVAAGLIQRRFRPTPVCPQPAVGAPAFIPAGVYLFTAFAIVAFSSNGLDPSRW
jgi:hypothetical protein